MERDDAERLLQPVIRLRAAMEPARVERDDADDLMLRRDIRICRNGARSRGAGRPANFVAGNNAVTQPQWSPLAWSGTTAADHDRTRQIIVPQWSPLAWSGTAALECI